MKSTKTENNTLNSLQVTPSAKKVLVAMSGGVDSFAAALLLLEQGYSIEGVTFVTWTEQTDAIVSSENKKTPLQAAKDTATLCQSLGIKHHILDLTKEFNDLVIAHFVEEYLQGHTPNPCTFCNSAFKFHYLQKTAIRLGFSKIATGHYAGISCQNNRYVISRSVDDWKDQSYMLWNLSQDILKMCLFPLEMFPKETIKKYVAEKGFARQAQVQESFNICFIPDNKYKDFLFRKIPGLKEQLSQGNMLNEKNEIIGKHDGFPFYTIGQSKSLVHTSSEKLYVERVGAAQNELYLSPKNKVFKTQLIVNTLNFVKYERLSGKHRLYTRIRGKDTGMFAKVCFENEQAIVYFEQPVFAPALGQSAVFYEGNEVVCGGIISAIGE